MNSNWSKRKAKLKPVLKPLHWCYCLSLVNLTTHAWVHTPLHIFFCGTATKPQREHHKNTTKHQPNLLHHPPPRQGDQHNLQQEEMLRSSNGWFFPFAMFFLSTSESVIKSDKKLNWLKFPISKLFFACDTASIYKQLYILAGERVTVFFDVK